MWAVVELLNLNKFSKTIFHIIIYILFLFVILSFFGPILWPNRFDHNFSTTIADFIQTLVVIVALYNPIWIVEEKHKQFGPKPKFIFRKSEYFIREASHAYPGGYLFDGFHIFFGVINEGQTKINSAEVSIIEVEIFNEESNDFILLESFFPSSFPWVSVSSESNSRITNLDINPQQTRFFEFGIGWDVYCEENHQSEQPFELLAKKYPSNSRFFLYQGQYRIKLALYAENISSSVFMINLDWRANKMWEYDFQKVINNFDLSIKQLK